MTQTPPFSDISENGYACGRVNFAFVAHSARVSSESPVDLYIMGMREVG